MDDTSQTKTLVLCADDAGALVSDLQVIWRSLDTKDFEVTEELLPRSQTPAGEQALSGFFARSAPDIVLLCSNRDAPGHVQALLEVMRRELIEAPVVLAAETAELDLDSILQMGVTDFIAPPLRACEVLPRLRRLRRATDRGNRASVELKKALGLQQFIGESPALLDAIRRIPRLANCDVSVFIIGETGTGKEMFGRAIHYLSPRTSKPFIPVNCGAIPPELVENELFGHEQGAYTGAHRATHGLIHEAQGGTLFLDEIDSLPLSTQVKLLRFLQDQVYRPLGSRKMCQADVRIVAASNVDMEQAVRVGRFRSDLFYRINVLPLSLPPLRERKEDIPLLANHFLEKHALVMKSPARQLTPSALQKLLAHSWPGNVRELENIMQRALVLADQQTIRSENIVLPNLASVPPSASFRDLKARVIVEFERSYLRQMLESHEGNITHAARAARKNRRAFWQLLRKHKLQVLPPPSVENSRSCLDKTRLR